MRLKDLLKNLNYSIVSGQEDIDINKVEYDSRKVHAGDVFFCIKGFKVDGHEFAKKAVMQGAAAVVCEEVLDSVDSCTVVRVEDSRKALAVASSNFYGEPWKSLKMIGITGTNGKTTSTYMMKAILEEAGFKVGLIGTVANYIGDKKIPSHRTTPESLELHELFKEMLDNKVTHCVMEVSSHSLSLDRVFGIEFSEGIFTNLTQDHLDFHKTFENYYEAKLKLFNSSSTAIINIDDEYGKKVYKDVSCRKISYGVDGISDIMAKNIYIHSKGVEFDIQYKNQMEHIMLNIPGKYNVYNALGSAAACLNEGVSLKAVKKGLERVFVPGRCEIVTKDYNLDFEVIVDYAHSPDGLENILKTVREFTKGRLITVFGCGGDRDKTKRPIMGRIASSLSDITVITSDNPRSEDPEAIIDDILKGVKGNNYVVIENRREAIEKAIKIAKKDDIILVAGKGHEDYQEFKHGIIRFDEREIIADIIKELF
ncbi:UDP-N-acetylmuramoyl-L-alanyl-D-glutamate--2,6-diaminopimelate ligase [Clostridium sp. SYSU_GA19001]|uniref:UDP-N-acetylmuramoyl-L-alanyl-D-glutamate--2, 6-diaminopimelate ligase n=1 Tax=Clostridium caldaquaticum TaxID=2940653 RepID=UPI0020772172|nr:UDP-N-acetylmuramoyl-L-alanyl-D-glutamate--2,6-diaminopimelate ligase [Clostridium caldaquaticum]MCM8711004.1 UDP-N-acetylmuramoyl-L-alanyl-D-glutamate--2,6-diaminopimelate ligase [Clostridium caldaquaticum]